MQREPVVLLGVVAAVEVMVLMVGGDATCGVGGVGGMCCSCVGAGMMVIIG